MDDPPLISGFPTQDIQYFQLIYLFRRQVDREPWMGRHLLWMSLVKNWKNQLGAQREEEEEEKNKNQNKRQLIDK
jgi:hypothetical protein